MIKEFSIHARPTNKKATAAFSICFFASFAVLAVSSFLPIYRGLVQLLGMGLLVAAILIYTKFLSPRYFYEIAYDSDGVPLFIVNQVIGKRMSTLCRVAFYEIVKVEGESAEERKSHKTPAGVRKYNYVPTLMPERTCRIYTSGRHERAEIVIEVSDEIASLLAEYAKEAREMMKASEDEEEY